jgi:MerR family copper efflux transcriptional regulator
MRINELAACTGTASKTIRYYESVGLLPEPARSANGYREYAERDVDRLTFIRRCRELQIPIEQLKKLVQVQMDQSASCQEVDQIVQNQLEKIRKTRHELALLEESLCELDACCQNNTVSDCAILQRLNQPE